MEDLEKKENIKIEITTALPSDARAIREVQYKTWLATYPNEAAGITVDDIEDRFKDSFSDENIRKREEYMRSQPPTTKNFVVKIDSKIAGFATAVRHEDKNQLQAIYMLPELQGMGIGKKLWDEALKFFDPSKDIIVHVADYNTQAINFYKRLGFEDTGKRFSDERFNMKSGASIPEMEMVIRRTT